jgi:APA family basic amino acid/polyamine antiporter
MVAQAKNAGLKKVLGPTDLVFMGIGAIIGTGIFPGGMLRGLDRYSVRRAAELSFEVRR